MNQNVLSGARAWPTLAIVAKAGSGLQFVCAPPIFALDNQARAICHSIGRNVPPWKVPEKLSGAWVFRGTRMPVATVFDKPRRWPDAIAGQGRSGLRRARPALESVQQRHGTASAEP